MWGCWGDVVEHERLQVAGVGHGHQDQEVVAAGDHEQRQRLGAGDDEVTEAFDGDEQAALRARSSSRSRRAARCGPRLAVVRINAADVSVVAL
jgi:hypothetical protein